MKSEVTGKKLFDDDSPTSVKFIKDVRLPSEMDNTIVLDSTKDSDIHSTSETDVIQCSVEEVGDKHDFLKTPRSNLKRCITESRNDIISLEDVQIKSEKIKKKEDSFIYQKDSSFRYNLRKSFGLGNESVVSIKSSTLKTPKANCNEDEKLHPLMNKLMSSLKKTPDGPYLSKSKLRNIEKWLTDNDIETVRTPPFANLNVTPQSSRKSIVTPISRKRKDSDGNSSVDSEVQKVLVAVYGNDWKKKNVLKKCRTEPKNKNVLLPTTKTDIKGNKRPKLVEGSTRPVRRNILSQAKRIPNDDMDNQDGLEFLGVEKINLNLSGSSDLVIAKNFNDFKMRKCYDDGSSCDSWKPRSTRKKKMIDLPPGQSATKKTPKVLSAVKKRLEEKGGVSTPKTPLKTFLASLSVSTPTTRCHPEAQYFKVNFKTKKEELVKKLYKLYNNEVFEGKLAEDMNFSWNVKLRGTAGFCYNKRITKSTGEVIRSSRIELSTKIVDRADRLRDTLIHELCHAASWVIDGVLDGHGAVWGSWVDKAMKRFPELPPIRRCHNYEIMSKYTYRCTGCGYSINRHSKSINTERKRCGYCYGVLELLVNKKKRGKGEVPEFDTTRTLRTPNNFAIFVKENYHSVKSTKANAKHAEIMKILSQQYALVKNAGVAGTGQIVPPDNN